MDSLGEHGGASDEQRDAGIGPAQIADRQPARLQTNVGADHGPWSRFSLRPSDRLAAFSGGRRVYDLAAGEQFLLRVYSASRSASVGRDRCLNVCGAAQI